MKCDDALEARFEASFMRNLPLQHAAAPVVCIRRLHPIAIPSAAQHAGSLSRIVRCNDALPADVEETMAAVLQYLVHDAAAQPITKVRAFSGQGCGESGG